LITIVNHCNIETVKPKSVRKKFYNIQEVADELRVYKWTIYNWEKAGKIPKAARDPMNGYRIYTEIDLKKIKKISGRD